VIGGGTSVVAIATRVAFDFGPITTLDADFWVRRPKKAQEWHF
jgi:hypothetical protein